MSLRITGGSGQVSLEGLNLRQLSERQCERGGTGTDVGRFIRTKWEKVLDRHANSKSIIGSDGGILIRNRFTSRPRVLMDLISSTNSVFSGSQVLYFVCGFTTSNCAWEPDDLDIYTCEGRGEIILQFFEGEGYEAELKPSGRERDRPYMGDTAVACVVTLKKGQGRKVDLIFSGTGSALSPIARFYGTHVMNILTAEEVVVAYPESTFDAVCYRRWGATGGDGRPGGIEKYEGRGFKLRHFSENIEHVRLWGTGRFYCPHATRSFLDDGCVMLRFSNGGLQLGDVERAGIFDTVEWVWGGQGCACCEHYESPRFLDEGDEEW